MSASVAAAPPPKTKTAVRTFPACTASSSVVTAWCMVNGTTKARPNAGDIIVYGAVTSITIDTTHTPPRVAASGLSVDLEET
jgi:hypothetical protein